MTRAAACLAACLVLAAAPACAGPDRLSILLGSHHVDTTLVFEESNPGVFLTWEDRALGLDWSLGVFRNSYGNTSVAATAALPLIRRPRFQAAVFVGLATYGDEARNWPVRAGEVVPIAGLQLRSGNSFVQILPDRGNPDATITFGVTIPLKGH